MSHVVHSSIIVTTYDMGRADGARSIAIQLMGDVVTPIVSANVNGYYTFLVGPDGSKAGWATAEFAAEQRRLFIRWLIAQEHEDRSSPYSWVEVTYPEHRGFEINLTTRDDREEL